MSDYVRKRAVRYRLKRKEVEYFEKLLSTETNDFLPDLLTDYFELKEDYKLEGKADFVASSGCDYANGDEFYIDYLIGYEYGYHSGDYITSRELTQEENDKYLPMFKEKFPLLEIDELHYVDYCYYNGVDEPTAYDIEPIE